MQHLPALIGIATALAAGAASPGPSFVMVARTSASMGRFNGLLAALGMGLGGLIFATASLLGLHGLLLAVPSLYLLLKVGGGLYLAYLGWRIWRGARTPLVAEMDLPGASATISARFLFLGLVTQLSNPKTAIVYASVFAAFLPSDSSVGLKVIIALLVFLIEASWYALVALVLSSPKASNVYLRGKAWFDRVAGGVMIALGIKLLTSYEGR
ncbi:threonine transporter [Herbaspirillum rubrisubalbicans]|uniref:Threonine transporter n=1 Tax=Herbaspirillum rubrisubalbicans TaxID=80842 RepID=A0ABX9C4S5_9BURK|nr:LysE family transporter [Herbaspirillum rubrisubalbicans]NQE49997.1 threonine transporter [Herbaspirillum rubrisubalbicans]RAM65189.1 threonine transporter [Herbaspirillum rubrisubalbicans]RAN48821.1 threonine transporter [Herbaspirillum rubrisubalbicans]